LFVSSAALAQEVLDEKRFHKAIGGALLEVRNLVSDGLFTAFHGEKNWGIAREYPGPTGLSDQSKTVNLQIVS
jgi:hypothetical protein